MFLRQCLQEVRTRHGEFDLFTGDEGRGSWHDSRDTHQVYREVDAALVLAHAEARRSDSRNVARAMAERLW